MDLRYLKTLTGSTRRIHVSNSELRRQSTVRSASNTHAYSPSWVFIVRKALRRCDEDSCNNERWSISLHCRVLVTWYFQPRSPRQVLFTRFHVTAFLTQELHRNTFGISLLSLCLLTHDKCYGYEDFSCALIIQYIYSTSFLRIH
jgi:hypothetical protein